MDWNDWILGQELYLRGGAFISGLLIIAGWEYIAPRRTPALSRVQRWSSNLGLAAINTLILRMLFPIAATGAAIIAAQNDWGLIPALGLPFALATLLALVTLDLIIYLQHVAFHALPILWRLHRVHHADPGFDVTTGVRFHPLEIILSMLIKIITVLVIGPTVFAVVIFEVLLNAAAMFNHGNISLPALLDKNLRRLIVTPDMHRVHHSIEYQEMNSNFGFCLSLWDRLFGTYQAQPRAGHSAMQIGLPGYTDPTSTRSLTGLLLLPYTGGPGQNRFGIRRQGPSK